MNIIYKEIYNLQEIKKKSRPLAWAWICLGLGAICAYFMTTLKSPSDGVNALLIGMTAIGVFGLVTLLCYYSIGDSRAPMHTPTHKMLEATQVFYPRSVRETLTKAVVDKDEDALKGIKKSTTPDLILVRYSDKDDTIIYSQVIDNSDNAMTAITDIIATKAEYTS